MKRKKKQLNNMALIEALDSTEFQGLRCLMGTPITKL